MFIQEYGLPSYWSTCLLSPNKSAPIPKGQLTLWVHQAWPTISATLIFLKYSMKVTSMSSVFSRSLIFSPMLPIRRSRSTTSTIPMTASLISPPSSAIILTGSLMQPSACETAAPAISWRFGGIRFAVSAGILSLAASCAPTLTLLIATNAWSA